MSVDNYEIMTSVDCAFDDTIIPDIIEVLQKIYNGEIQGKTIVLHIPQRLVTPQEGILTFQTIDV